MTSLVAQPASPAAAGIDQRIAQNRHRLQQSSAVGMESFIREELANTLLDCREPGWKGEPSDPVRWESYETAKQFLLALPLGTPHPSPGAEAEADGDLTLGWFRSARRVLSISFSPDGCLHYAALIGHQSHRGSVPFDGTVPETILSLIAEVR